MKKNMGTADRVIRISLVMLIVGLYATNVISGFIGLALLAVTGIFLLTGLVRFCPLYALFGLNTCAVKPKASPTNRI